MVQCSFAVTGARPAPLCASENVATGREDGRMLGYAFEVGGGEMAYAGIVTPTAFNLKAPHGGGVFHAYESCIPACCT